VLGDGKLTAATHIDRAADEGTMRTVTVGNPTRRSTTG